MPQGYAQSIHLLMNDSFSFSISFASNNSSGPTAELSRAAQRRRLE
jgi:hypothetical protein